MPVIEVSNLTKAFRTYKKQPGFSGAVKGLFHRQYEQTLAVNEVSFKIEPGELVGFLGPNGAGKTTTLKMLAGLLYPTSGAAKVLGYTPWERDDGYRRQFALVLGQKNQLWWDLPARESLELNAKIYGIPADRFERTVAEMTELLAVKDKLNVSVRELSLGERMKMELIASLLHQPKVLVPRRTDHRPGRDFAKDRPRFHPPPQRGAKDHDFAHQPLHGRHPGTLRARHHH